MKFAHKQKHLVLQPVVVALGHDSRGPAQLEQEAFHLRTGSNICLTRKLCTTRSIP